MNDWLPSSDDESVELEAMRFKLQSLKKHEHKGESFLQSDSESEATPPRKGSSTFVRNKQSDSCSENDSDSESSCLVEHGCASPKKQFEVTTGRKDSRRERTKRSLSPANFGKNDAPRSKEKDCIRDIECLDITPQTGEVIGSDFDLDSLDDELLGEIFQQAEHEFKALRGNMCSLHIPRSLEASSSSSSSESSIQNSSSTSSGTNVAEWFPQRSSPQGKPTISGTPSTEECRGDSTLPHRRVYAKDPQCQDEKQTLVRDATLEEEERINAYLTDLQCPRKAHESQQEKELRHCFPLIDYDNECSDDKSEIDKDDTDDSAWINELLREQQKEATGEHSVASVTKPIPQNTTANESQSHCFSDLQFSQAFGFEHTENHETVPNSSTDLQQEKYRENDEVFDSPPTCEDSSRTSKKGAIDCDERYSEIDPSRFPLPVHRDRFPPLVHHFTAESHPQDHRRRQSVLSVFDKPQIARFFRIKFENFNTMQSELSNVLAHSDDHLVVAAPTGAGKTAVFEMAMARFFNVDLQAFRHDDVHQASSHAALTVSKYRKIVYLSPSKALCEERFEDWSSRLSETKLGIEISVVTGDGDPGDAFRDVASAQVILSTPEKWDSLTRRWTENFVLLASVKLVLLDEIHLIADPSRGSCLEAVVHRMKSIQHTAQCCVLTQGDVLSSSFVSTTPEAISSPLRIVAVSATLPNIAEIAEFLNANEAYVFDESFRPVPLTTHVVGLGNAGENSFRFWNGLDREVAPIIQRFSFGRPTLVFCHSKAETERLADTLAKCPGIGKEGQSDIASKTKLARLQRVLYAGIAYHHAGMELDDRRLVEKSFASNKVRVLCTTSTLAMGVNLPARLVVIKGTKAWRGTGGYQDLDQASLLQMMGRAGRVGFDTCGTAVIMTETKTKVQFERMATSGIRQAKSQLLTTFQEILNAEISQRIITDINSGFNWIKGTLYYIQLKRDPEAHSIRVVSEHSIDTHVHSLLRESFRKLQQVGVISLREGFSLKPHEGCNIMSQHLVDYETMKIFSSLPVNVSQSELLKAVCCIERLQRPVKRSEKKTLNALHKLIRYKLDGPPSKIRVQKAWEKAFVLLQSSIGRLPIDDYTLRSESLGMVDFASRMLAAAEEFGARCSRNGDVVVQSIRLRRSLSTSLWCSRDGVLGQFSSLEDHTITSLKFNGVTTFEDVLKENELSLEKAASRMAPFGTNLKHAVERVLAGSLKIDAQVNRKDGSASPLSVSCNLRARENVLPELNCTTSPGEAPEVKYTLVAHTDRPNGCILYRRGVTKEGVVEFACPQKFGKITIHLVASIVGLDDILELKGLSEVQHTSQETAMQTLRLRKRQFKVGPGSRHAQTKPKQKQRPILVTPSPRPMVISRQAKFTSNVCQYNRAEYPKEVVDLATTEAAEAKHGEGEEILGEDVHQERIQPITKLLKSSSTNHLSDETSQKGQIPNLRSGINDRAHLSVARRESNDRTQKSSFEQTARDAKVRNAPHENAEEHSPKIWQGQDNLHETVRPTLGTLPNQKAYLETQQIPTTKWRRAKRELERTQKHAFARNKENPFTKYEHDPNDAEATLDVLSHRATPPRKSPLSIIPPQSQRAVDSAYKNAFNCNGAPSGSRRFRASSQNRRRFFSSPLSAQHMPAQLATPVSDCLPRYASYPLQAQPPLVSQQYICDPWLPQSFADQNQTQSHFTRPRASFDAEQRPETVVGPSLWHEHNFTANRRFFSGEVDTNFGRRDYIQNFPDQQNIPNRFHRSFTQRPAAMLAQTSRTSALANGFHSGEQAMTRFEEAFF